MEYRTGFLLTPDQRASFNANDAKMKDALKHIAYEERQHLQYLADYMDQKIG